MSSEAYTLSVLIQAKRNLIAEPHDWLVELESEPVL